VTFFVLKNLLIVWDSRQRRLCKNSIYHFAIADPQLFTSIRPKCVSVRRQWKEVAQKMIALCSSQNIRITLTPCRTCTVCSSTRLTLRNQYVVMEYKLGLQPIYAWTAWHTHWTDVCRHSCHHSTRPRTCWAWNYTADCSVSSALMSFHLCSLQLHSSASRPITFVADHAWLLTHTKLTRI